MSDVVFTSSYCPVILGLGIQKNPSSNVALRKIREHGSAHGVDILYCGIWKMSRRLSRKKNTQCLMKTIQEVLLIKL